ncbi:MAG: hypothetical protein L0Z62_11420 [Gemmataceae bacterium]|nr:hypothetical protein [Gemmataceae bacterium]
MTINIDISAEAEQRLRRLAAERGLSLDEYARTVLEQAASHRGPPPPAAEAAAAGQASEAPRNVIGKFAHLGLTVSQEAIEEVRREMWASFPREIPKPQES